MYRTALQNKESLVYLKMSLSVYSHSTSGAQRSISKTKEEGNDLFKKKKNNKHL